MRVLRKRLNIFITSFLLVLIFLVSGCKDPVITSVDRTPINATNDPIQEPVANQGNYKWECSNGHFYLIPVAQYSISAMVMSTKKYYWGWQAKLIPTDLALAWGRLIDPELKKYIIYSQGNRWYYYRYKADCPVDGTYIASHSSNHHLIASNENVLAAIRTIHKNDTVKLDGFLVDITGQYKDRQYFLKSSLSRNDRGAGACEVFMVTKVRICERVYE